jgi:Dienelactone hydrolase family
MLYTPAGKGPFPALVVIHEWWGLNDWVKDQAAKLADQDTWRWLLISTGEKLQLRLPRLTKSCMVFLKIVRPAISTPRWSF